MANIEEKEKEPHVQGLESNNITEFKSGLYQDGPPNIQPKGTQRFALNMVDDKNAINVKNNEGGNTIFSSIPDDYIPLGSVYVGNNDTVLFFVKEDESLSEIGIINEAGKYTTLINSPVLTFKQQYPIQATYRMRRGCERNIYFTDGYNPIRTINIDNIEYYTDDGINYINDRFNLIKDINVFPIYSNISILNNGGSLPCGAYSLFVQYFDSNGNPTEWVADTDAIYIYKDSLFSRWDIITGNYNELGDLSENNPLSEGPSTKAISISFSQLDTDYSSYRIGIACAVDGSGQFTKFLATAKNIITDTNVLISSISSLDEISPDELLIDKANIRTAKTIEQFENNLIIGNVKGFEGDICAFQRYASKITADCVILNQKALNVMTPGDTKSPIQNTLIDTNDGVGYMSGEVYSFGIMYVMKSGFITPVYHIPGKSQRNTSTTVFDTSYSVQGQRLIGMDNSKNSCASSQYYKPSNCLNNDYWGIDNNGDALSGSNIRHHQFPTRNSSTPLVSGNFGDDVPTRFLTYGFEITSYLFGILRDNNNNGYMNPFFIPSTVPDANKPDIFQFEDTDSNGNSTFQITLVYNYNIIINGVTKNYSNSTVYFWNDLLLDSTFYLDDEGNYIPYADIQPIILPATFSEAGDIPSDAIINITFASITFPQWGITTPADPSDPTTTDIYGWTYGKVVNLTEVLGPNGEDIDEYRTTLIPVNTNSVPAEQYINVKLRTQISSIKNPKLGDYYINKFGIHFSNISFPSATELGVIDDEVIGYYIVRNERTDENKLIFDTGFIAPITKAVSKSKGSALGFQNYSSVGMLLPEYGNLSSSVQNTKEAKPRPDPNNGPNSGVPSFTNLIDSNRANLITVGHKFRYKKIEPKRFTIQQEGKYSATKFNNVIVPMNGWGHAPQYGFLSRFRFGDVMDGSTYTATIDSGVKEKHMPWQNVDKGSRPNDPNSRGIDGYCLKMAVRENQMTYSNSGNNFKITREQQADIKELQGIEWKQSIIDATTAIYNIQTDHTVNVIEFGDEYNNPLSNVPYQYNVGDIPYVKIIQDVIEPYSDFIYRPYIKTHLNMKSASQSSATVFGGDTYINPLRFSTTIKQSITPAKMLMDARNRVGKWILIGVIAAVGIAASIFTGGSSAVGAGVLISVIATSMVAVGGTCLIAANMAKNEKFINNYNKAYDDGIDKSVRDDFSIFEFEFVRNFTSCNDVRDWSWWDEKGKNNSDENPTVSFSDDQINYITDCLSDIWVESDVNIAMRVKGGDTFLPNPSDFMSGCERPEQAASYTDKDSGGLGGTSHINWIMTRATQEGVGGIYLQPINRLEFLAMTKTLFPNLNRVHGKEYYGYAMGELFAFNEDLMQRSYKKFFHLSMDYDCCSNCNEEFPQRFFWSEQSFQEELVDSYSIFKENNYRDVDGETGAIINMVKINSSLYAHTEEGLWLVPKNNQMVVMQDAVSFIGTGELYSQPLQLIIDSKTGNSAGLRHRQAFINTEDGYFFVCEKERKVYNYDPKSTNSLSKKADALIDISLNGLSFWFKDNIELQQALKYRTSTNGRKYPLEDCPASKLGIGFLFTNDSYNGRIILTKKDFYEEFNGNISTITDNSWTISYDIKNKVWMSWHSYLPNFYYYINDRHFSWIYGQNNIWKHNVEGLYNNFYNVQYPFIIDYVSNANPTIPRIFDCVQVICGAEKYDSNTQQFITVVDAFFNKVIAYNSRQCTGLLTIKKKSDLEGDGYLSGQVVEPDTSTILADNNEQIWMLNNFRDIRIDYSQAIFDQSIAARSLQYFIDKVLNVSSMDINKKWNEMESLRDKYLQIRFIFDNVSDVRLSLNFTNENEKISIR